MVFPFKAERYNSIIKLVKTGMKQVDVARTLGMEQYTVHSAVNRARRIGDLPKKKYTDSHFYYAAQMRHGGTGSLKELMSTMDVKAAQWLIDETPEGCTITDTLRGIVQDAYEESKE